MRKHYNSTYLFSDKISFDRMRRSSTGITGGKRRISDIFSTKNRGFSTHIKMATFAGFAKQTGAASYFESVERVRSHSQREKGAGTDERKHHARPIDEAVECDEATQRRWLC
jgi:hypothetical protein